jgi:hypothetical protein
MVQGLQQETEDLAGQNNDLQSTATNFRGLKIRYPQGCEGSTLSPALYLSVSATFLQNLRFIRLLRIPFYKALQRIGAKMGVWGLIGYTGYNDDWDFR